MTLYDPTTENLTTGFYDANNIMSATYGGRFKHTTHNCFYDVMYNSNNNNLWNGVI